MSGYVRYITKDGDRWDRIAQAHYGDPYAYARIIAANKTVPIIPLLPGGIELAIPVIARPLVDTTNLPPWKR